MVHNIHKQSYNIYMYQQSVFNMISSQKVQVVRKPDNGKTEHHTSLMMNLFSLNELTFYCYYYIELLSFLITNEGCTTQNILKDTDTNETQTFFLHPLKPKALWVDKPLLLHIEEVKLLMFIVSLVEELTQDDTKVSLCFCAPYLS